MKFNLDFESLHDGFPAGWRTRIGITSESSDTRREPSVFVDSLNVFSGKYSVCIELTGQNIDFQVISFLLPNNYDGKEITLSGYIKTENVTDGYAGLWMRIDPMLAIDNMSQRGITGTTEWRRYEITLPLKPEMTQQIIVGGLLSGKGKIWLDNFSVAIDGVDISQAKIFKKPVSPADKDRKFDNGSRVEFSGKLTEQQIDDLELLGKLWGFLKYHHPTIAAGKYNWDNELFRILPKYLKINNPNKRDKFLVKWINNLGHIPRITPAPVKADAHIRPDLSWMDNLSPKLSATLRRVYENRNQDGNYYINLVPFAENPVFTNERPYSEMAYPDAGFRLMSLFRYWSSVEYFFPEKYQTDKPWSEVLREYIPVFIEAKDELEYEIAALRIIGEICDSHATLWRGGDKIDSLRGNNYAPFRVQFVENKLIVTDYYNPEKCTLDIGDVITEIDGRNVEAIVDSLRPYYPASNESARLRDMSEDILRARDNKININGQSFPLYPKDSLNMYYLYKVNMGEKSYKMLDDNIGYITLANIQEIDVINIKQTFINTRGIVIDMRNYPLSVVMYAMGNWFAAEDKPFIKFSKGSVNNPSAFYFQEPSILTPPKNGLSYNGKVVVLVNEITQSQAECTAMAFQAGSNTTIIGSQTAGADGNVSTIVLPGGLHTMISGRGAYYPDGAPAQRIGIVPDIEVKPTIKGIREGRDELLDKAIEVIKL